MSAASLIATHLNASVGEILCDSEVEDSLRNGCIKGLNVQSEALLGSIFVEIEPRLIAKCALEVGSSIDKANMLYLDTLKSGFPKCVLWEKSIGHLI